MLNGLIITTIVSSVLILLILALSPLLERYFSNRVKAWVWLLLAVRMLIPYAPNDPVSPSLNIPLPEEKYVTVDTAGVGIELEPEATGEAAAAITVSDIILAVWAVGAVSFFSVNVIRLSLIHI